MNFEFSEFRNIFVQKVNKFSQFWTIYNSRHFKHTDLSHSLLAHIEASENLNFKKWNPFI